MAAEFKEGVRGVRRRRSRCESRTAPPTIPYVVSSLRRHDQTGLRLFGRRGRHATIPGLNRSSATDALYMNLARLNDFGPLYVALRPSHILHPPRLVEAEASRAPGCNFRLLIDGSAEAALTR